LKLSPRIRTALVFAALCFLALVWEVFALSSGGHAWSFSRFVWALSAQPLFVLAVGILIGHFFFQKEDCLHCGFRPYRRDRLSEAAFDRALVLVHCGIKAGMTLEASKRPAGLPDFEVRQ
jgi:hypothetical protein